MALDLLTVIIFFSVTNAIIQTSNSVEYFVASNGYDSNQCGNSTNPCGTLYQTSMLIQQQQQSFIEEFRINVINGQNKNEIQQYYTLNNTNKFNPCFPKPFDSTNKIEITFIGNTSIS
eukprot:296582_1